MVIPVYQPYTSCEIRGDFIPRGKVTLSFLFSASDLALQMFVPFYEDIMSK